jgi:hypothetical protein
MGGGGLVAFLGVGAGVSGVAISNAVAMRPAVPGGVGSLLLGGVAIALLLSSSAAASTLGLG